MDCLENDINVAIAAIEYYIISIEEKLIAENAGDKEWTDLQPFKDTLTNLKFMQSIYG